MNGEIYDLRILRGAELGGAGVAPYPDDEDEEEDEDGEEEH